MKTSQRNTFYGRKSEYASLRDEILSFCTSSVDDPPFRIIGVSGYGGVGKSYLLTSVLNEIKPGLRESILIRVDGSNEKLLSDFAGLINHQLAPSSLPHPADPKQDYFIETHRLIHILYSLREAVDRDLDRNKDLADNIKKLAKAIYKFRPVITKIPKVGTAISSLLSVLEDVKVEEHLQEANEALQAVGSLKQTLGLFGRGRRSRLRKDPFNTVADGYTTDSIAAFRGYQAKDALKPLSGKIKGVNRLILIIDDFETTGKVLGDFLVECLLGRLKRRLPLLVIFLGRDDIADSHTGFNQHFAQDIVLKIRLEPLDKSNGTKYLQEAGYSPGEATDIYVKSRGYPFMLSLFAELKSSDEKQSAIFHKRFFERTTHWMTEQEKHWLLNLCYLDLVNESTIEAMMPEVNPSVVMDWFANEASVRDVAATGFAVQPFIRKMVLEYHTKLIGSKKRDKFVALARQAMEGECPASPVLTSPKK